MLKFLTKVLKMLQKLQNIENVHEFTKSFVVKLIPFLWISLFSEL